MFDHRYQVVVADTEEAKKVHYRLRYQVYCLDKGFEAPDKFSDEMERDEYDDMSVHFLVKDKYTGHWVAALRLVIADVKDIPASQVVEINDRSGMQVGERVAEISRLSIVKGHRVSNNEKSSANKYRHRHAIPEIMLGLIRATKVYCKDVGVRHGLFLCKRSMIRVLEKCGMGIEPAGSACEHKGTRYPYWVMGTEKALGGFKKTSDRLLNMFESDQHAYCTYSDLMQLEQQQLVVA